MCTNRCIIFFVRLVKSVFGAGLGDSVKTDEMMWTFHIKKCYEIKKKNAAIFYICNAK